MDNTFRTKNVAVLAAAFAAAIAVSLGVGSALAAPPLKNAERKCLDAGGHFAWQATQYSCTGLPSAAVMDSAKRQCLNSYKGYAFSWWQDTTTGKWSYVCSFPV